MKFLIIFALVSAAAFAAPTVSPDFADVEDEFSMPVETEAPAAVEQAPEEPAVVNAATEAAAPAATEAPAVEPAATEAPEVAAPEPVEETPAEEPAAETPETAPAAETEAPETSATEGPAAAEDDEETDEDTKEDDKAAEENAAVPSDDEPTSSSSSDSDDKTPAADAEEPAAAADDEESSDSNEDDDEEDEDVAATTTSAPAVPENAEESVHEVGAPISTDPETADQKEEAAAAAETVPEQEEAGLPVVATAISTGSTATVNGVTVRFALTATWAVAGDRKRGYVVKITNNSDKDVCGVTFTPNTKTSDVWNLAVAEDGSFSTKDLHLAAGATANQFGYISASRSTPTIVEVTYC